MIYVCFFASLQLVKEVTRAALQKDGGPEIFLKEQQVKKRGQFKVDVYLIKFAKRLLFGPNIVSVKKRYQPYAYTMTKTGTICILDQEQAVLDSLHLILTDEGYHCFTAHNRQELQALLAQHPVNMIIMDSHHSGGGFIRSIKVRHRSTTVLLLSEYANIEAAMRSVAHGADALVIKPLDFDEVIAVVKKHLGSVHK